MGGATSEREEKGSAKYETGQGIGDGEEYRSRKTAGDLMLF